MKLANVMCEERCWTCTHREAKLDIHNGYVGVKYVCLLAECEYEEREDDSYDCYEEIYGEHQ